MSATRELLRPSRARTAALRVAVLLACGEGPEPDRPWDTLPVAGVPFLLRRLRELEAAGVQRVVLHAARRGDLYRALVGCGTQLGLHVVHSSGPLVRGLPGLLTKHARHLAGAERPTIERSDRVLLAGETLRLSSWSDLHRLSLAVLRGAWPASGELPPGGVAPGGIRGRSPCAASGSYVGQGAVLGEGVRLREACLEERVHAGAAADLERVVVLPGAALPGGCRLRGGVVDGARWIPVEPEARAELTAPLVEPRERGSRQVLGRLLRPLRWAARRLLHGAPAAAVQVELHPGLAVLRLSGLLDHDLAVALARAALPGAPVVALDLGRCEEADPTGLEALRAWAARCRGAGGTPLGLDAPARLQDQLERSGVEQVLELYPSLAEALADTSLAPRRGGDQEEGHAC